MAFFARQTVVDARAPLAYTSGAMKTARPLTALGAFLATAFLGVRADEMAAPSPAPVTPPAAVTEVAPVHNAPARNDGTVPPIAPWTDPAAEAEALDSFNADPEKITEQLHEAAERQRELNNIQDN